MSLQVKKGDKLYSIAHLKCPRCQKGNLFTVANSYNLMKMLDMPDSCPVCKQDFVKEPGFYSGALWVSYPIVMGILILSGVVFHFVVKLSFYQVMIAAVVVLLALQPLIMRYSRAIWINFFVDYKKQ